MRSDDVFAAALALLRIMGAPIRDKPAAAVDPLMKCLRDIPKVFDSVFIRCFLDGFALDLPIIVPDCEWRINIQDRL